MAIKKKHPCPLYCIYCGAPRKRDIVGHYCPTLNCQWQYGYSTCPVKDEEEKPEPPKEEEKETDDDE
jgi:hypothetical protein